MAYLKTANWQLEQRSVPHSAATSPLQLLPHSSRDVLFSVPTAVGHVPTPHAFRTRWSSATMARAERRIFRHDGDEFRRYRAQNHVHRAGQGVDAAR